MCLNHTESQADKTNTLLECQHDTWKGWEEEKNDGKERESGMRADKEETSCRQESV